MDRSVLAVMLAGALRPSELSSALGVPLLALPVGRTGTALDAWLALLDALPLDRVRIVVNTAGDVETMRGLVPSRRLDGRGGAPIEIVAESAAWRGAGGVLKDASGGAAPDAVVMAIEATALPPGPLAPLLARLEPPVRGVVGICGEDEPAGVCAFARGALERVPSIGYFDLKEQLLPDLYAAGEPVVTARLAERAWRLRDRESYLDAVRASLSSGSPAPSAPHVDRAASVARTAVLDGAVIVEAGVVVEDGAVVHDAVVLRGATIGRGAVVSRCVVGPLALVEPGARVVREVVGGRAHDEAMRGRSVA